MLHYHMLREDIDHRRIVSFHDGHAPLNELNFLITPGGANGVAVSKVICYPYKVAYKFSDSVNNSSICKADLPIQPLKSLLLYNNRFNELCPIHSINLVPDVRIPFMQFYKHIINADMLRKQPIGPEVCNRKTKIRKTLWWEVTPPHPSAPTVLPPSRLRRSHLAHGIR